MNKDMYERRDFGIDKFELRETDSGQVISGMALPFNRDSEDLGGFVERIDSRAVEKTLADSDVVMLWQHDSTDPITRESTGLKLETRESGVFFEANAEDFTERQLDLLQRGVVKQMSFGFVTVSDEWQQDQEPVVRTLLDIDLREISPVTWPAYRQTSVAVRSAEEAGVTLPPSEEDKTQTESKAPDHDLLERKLRLLTVDTGLDE
jgi:HK97 family phage prohead protease